jgi:hypothetical protein
MRKRFVQSWGALRRAPSYRSAGTAVEFRPQGAEAERLRNRGTELCDCDIALHARRVAQFVRIG